MPDNTIDASTVAQCRPLIVVRASGPPLVIYDLDGLTRITPIIVVPDAVWTATSGPRTGRRKRHRATRRRMKAQGDQLPQWLSNPSSRRVAALMNERVIAAAEADAIGTAVDDAHVMLAEGDYVGVDHLLDLIGETSDSIARTLSKPPPGDI